MAPELILILTAPIWSLYLLWTLYLAVMNLIRARKAGKLSRVAYALGLPLLALGGLLDVLVNLIVCTMIFLELPREFLMTTRLKRHIRSGTGWRFKVSKFICSKLLDQFDPSGCHCD